jgi:hypothetical protein
MVLHVHGKGKQDRYVPLPQTTLQRLRLLFWKTHRSPTVPPSGCFQRPHATARAFRIAIANSRIESIADGNVCFRYTDNGSHQIRHLTLSGIEFIHRFLQHVLPCGTTKVRYYGLFSPSSKSQLERARQLLPPPSGPAQTNSSPQVADPETQVSTAS